MNVKVLLIEDSESYSILFNRYLKNIDRTNFEIDTVSEYCDALSIMIKNIHDIYIMDYYIGEKNGIELMKEAIANGFNGPVIFLTNEKNHGVDLEALDSGAYDYLIKEEVSPQTIEKSIRYTLSRVQLERKLKDQKTILETIIDSIPVGICVTDEELNFTHWNNQFIKIFELDEGELVSPLSKVIEFKKKNDDLYSNKYCEIKSPFLRTIQNRILTIEGMASSVKKHGIECVVKYQSLTIKNGKNRIYKIFSFIDIGAYKEREEQLKNTVSKVQTLMEKYANDTKDPRVFMDLADLEVTKMDSCMKIASVGV